MPTNPFFNNYADNQEQGLLDDLIIESIQIYGIDFYYLPRTIVHQDPIYAQADIASYNMALMVEMYVKSFDGFDGQGIFLSKWGMEIRDQMTLTISKRIFDTTIGLQAGLLRPNEGDLIFYPLNGKSFEVKFVQNKPIHYPLGFLPTYDLYCETFEYSNERFATGIPMIDAMNVNWSTNIYDYAINNENGFSLMDENGNIIVQSPYNYDQHAENLEDNIELVTEQGSNAIIDFLETDPYTPNWTKDL